MGRKKKSAKDHRTQLVVKPDDDITLRWLAAQDNKSASLRLLIRGAVAKYGYVDFFEVKLSELESIPDGHVRRTPDAVSEPVVVADTVVTTPAVTEEILHTIATREGPVRVEEPVVATASVTTDTGNIADAMRIFGETSVSQEATEPVDGVADAQEQSIMSSLATGASVEDLQAALASMKDDM